MDTLTDEIRSLIGGRKQDGRPFVTVSFAQSLDGCLSQKRGIATPLSNKKSLVFTHVLRGMHHGILIGKNTLNTDNPQLTVRHVRAPSPQRIILSSSLSLNTEAKIFHDSGSRPWIGTGYNCNLLAKKDLQKLGCRILSGPPGRDGVALVEFLRLLGNSGIESLMVEGGAGVINSFLRESLADLVVVTIAPVFLAGDCSPRLTPLRKIKMTKPGRYMLDDDVLMWGILR